MYKTCVLYINNFNKILFINNDGLKRKNVFCLSPRNRKFRGDGGSKSEKGGGGNFLVLVVHHSLQVGIFALSSDSFEFTHYYYGNTKT